jgi:hypothetical protein
MRERDVLLFLAFALALYGVLVWLGMRSMGCE